jgi:membrane-bound lytic murein transglycosylase B
MKQLISVWLSLLFLLFSNNLFATKISWNQWVVQLKKEAVSQGIDPALFDRIFKTIPGPNHQVLHFDHTQPEHRITFSEYRNSRGGKYKILVGRRELQFHRKLLQNVSRDFKVDPCVIVALWGMESSYGHYMGNFPVIKSLATLAYDSRRGDNFRHELLLALKIVNSKQVSLAKFKGEWAGASGQPQFLPSSWFKYAVDYDHDGRKDIWSSYPDVFASIANYLAKNGWHENEPWAIIVKLPDDFDEDINKIRPVKQWNKLGVRTLTGAPLPYQNLTANIIETDGGPTFLAFNNFRTLLTYNNSTYYVGTVGYMADRICQK